MSKQKVKRQSLWRSNLVPGRVEGIGVRYRGWSLSSFVAEIRIKFVPLFRWISFDFISSVWNWSLLTDGWNGQEGI